MERATGESGFLRLWSIGICLSLFVAVSCNTSTSNSNEASSKRRDREDSPGRIALSLGDNLAQLHYVFLIGAESETARRYEEITAQTVRNDAAKLEIELPPEELSASYDPHATEIIQRIKRSRGTQTAAIFAFVYHSESASWAADWLSRPTGSSRRLDVESGLLRLSMQFHAHAAVQLARALLPTKEILGEADAIESQLSKMSESSSGGRPEEFKAINERLSSLSSTVTLRVYLGSIPPEQQVERASPPAPPQAERRPSRLWILFLAIAVAANLVFAVVAFLFPQREGLLIVSPVIGFACAVTSGFMFSGVLGAIIGGLVFMVIPGTIYWMAESSPRRRERIARMVTSSRDADRLWAVTNIDPDQKGLALLHQSVVRDPELRVRYCAARALVNHGRFWELMETLESASKDPNSKEASDARYLYRVMGGDLLTEEWREVYSLVQKRNTEGQRTPVTVNVAFSHRKHWIEGDVAHNDEYYTIIVPPTCCFCGLNFGDVYVHLTDSLPIGFCRLCSNLIGGLKPVAIDGITKGRKDESVVTMSFLNDKVADLFRLANDKT